MTDDTTAQQPATAAGDGDVEQRPTAGIGRALLWRALVGVAALTLSVSASAWLLHAGIDPQADPWTVIPPRNTSLDAVRSWAIGNEDRDVAADADLVVVDSWRIAALPREMRRDRIAALKRKPGQSERILLARLSLTQACEGEPYWRSEWAATQIVTGTTSPRPNTPPESAIERHAAAARPLASGDRAWRAKTASAPSWLATENPSKPGCWHVHFGDAGWLAHLSGGDGAIIDQLIADGLDGILLDVDAGTTDRVDRLQLRELIARIARRTRDRQRGFIIALGNGGEALADRRLLRIVDAIAAAPLPAETSKDDVSPTDGYRQRIRNLAQARVDGVMVMIAAARDTSLSGAEQNRIDQLGFVRQIPSSGSPAPSH